MKSKMKKQFLLLLAAISMIMMAPIEPLMAGHSGNYVIKIKTRKHNVGNYHDYIAHPMLKVKMYGTKRNHTVTLYPGSHSGDDYWNTKKRGDITATSYAEHGKAKKENHSSSNTWGDRNAWWRDSSYFFHIESHDLGHIHRVRMNAITTGNVSTKSLAIEEIQIYKGRSVKHAKYRYLFPDSKKKITKKKRYFDIEDFRTSKPVENTDDVPPHKYGDINYQDNLQGKGTRKISLDYKSNKTTEHSSSEEVVSTFSIESSIEGEAGNLSGSLESKYENQVTTNISNSLSTQEEQSSSFETEVQPGEFLVLLNTYETKEAQYVASVSFTVRKKNGTKKKTIQSSVIWDAHNNYYRPLKKVPISKAFDHEPTKEELESLFKGLINKNDLLESF